MYASRKIPEWSIYESVCVLADMSLKYIYNYKYQRVCALVGIGTTPLPLPKASVYCVCTLPPPWTKGGGGTITCGNLR